MKIKKENDFFKVELPKTPLTKEDLINFQKTLSIYIESNQKYFDENYETIDFDDVNSLRFGYHHNGKEDFYMVCCF